MIPRLPQRDSIFGPLKVVIDGPGIKGHDEDQRREIERIVNKALIEKPDRVYEDTDRRYHEPQQKITVPNASYHSIASCPTARIRTVSGPFGKLFLERNDISSCNSFSLGRFAGRREPVGEQKTTKDN